MTTPMRIRATAREGFTEVRVLMAHVMETGQRKNASGLLIPAHFISELSVRHNGRLVLSAEFGPSVSANPYLGFKFKGGAKGDTLAVTWLDNKGDTRSEEAQIT